MKRIVILLIVFVGVLFFGSWVHANASGVSTSQSKSGVVVTTNPDGTTYLSTVVVGDTATRSATVGGTALNNTNIRLPEGFAASFSGLLNGILSFVLVISALLVFGFLIWGGFDWITSGGDKGKTDKARQKIVSAIIGLVIVASSYAILQLVIHFLGFSSLNDVFQSAGTIQGGAASNTTGLGALNATASATPQ